jgi:hypothetical protein
MTSQPPKENRAVIQIEIRNFYDDDLPLISYDQGMAIILHE